MDRPDASRRALALVTGASSGIGEAFARAYAAKGCDLALIARREDRLEALGRELTQTHGVEAFVIPTDLAGFDAHLTVIDAIRARGRTVDILVNNAGFSLPQDFAATAWARQRDFLMTLAVSACGLAHAVIPEMVANRGGAIINVASLAGFAPGAAGHSLYPGVKSLMIKFSQALDAELRAKGLRITAVCPGFTLTEFAKANGTQAAMDAASRRLFQTPTQVVVAAIRANERGRVVVVPGWHNKIAAALLRYMPEPLVSAAIRRGGEPYRLKD